MARIAAMYMPKGGVGKSFLAGHIATGLALAGRKVIAIDADPGQGHLSLRMKGIEPRGDLLRLLRDGPSEALLQPHPIYEHLSLVTTDPQDVDLFGPLLTGSGPYWPWLLKDRLQAWASQCDYIIMDTGPGFESPVTSCVIQAATELWLPYAVEYESYVSYQNLVNLLLPKARKEPVEFITHVIPNKVTLGRDRAPDAILGDLGDGERRRAELIRRARTNDSVAILEMLGDLCGDRMTNPVRLAEALSQRTAGGGEMVWDADPDSELATDLMYVIEAITRREGVVPHGNP